MSTTDRVEILRRPCTCGKGEYVVNSCSPDHGWVRAHQYWLEGTITCPECESKFDLYEKGSSIIRVSKRDVSAAEEMKSQCSKKVREVEAHAEARGHYDALASWLSSFPSVAAAFRALQGVIFTTTIATFRKRFSPTKEWVRREIYYSNLPKALGAMGHSDPELDKLVGEAKAMSAASSSGPPVLETICSRG